MLHAFKILQLLWAIALAAVFGYGTTVAVAQYGQWPPVQVAIAAVTAIYLAASVLVFRDHRAAWFAALSILILAWFRFLNHAIVYGYLMVRGEVNAGAPAAALGLAVELALTFGMASVLLVLAGRCRGEIRALMTRP